MKAFAMLIVCAAIAAALPAKAQVHSGKLDLSKLLCKEFVRMPKEQSEQIVTWLQGYYTLEDAPRIVDPDKIKADIVKLSEYCKRNGQVNMVAAADDVMGE